MGGEEEEMAGGGGWRRFDEKAICLSICFGLLEARLCVDRPQRPGPRLRLLFDLAPFDGSSREGGRGGTTEKERCFLVTSRAE